MSVELFGLDIDDYSFEGAVEHAKVLIAKEEPAQVITINPEMFEFAKYNKEFSDIVQQAEMVIPEGIGVKIALKINGHNVQRIPGIDFAKRMLEEAAKEGYPVAIIGAKSEVVTKAVENLKNELPNLNIVYYHDGYFDNDKAIYNELIDKAPKLILVAMGSPRQEKFIYYSKNYIKPALVIGIGGSLDVWSGFVKRAPKIYQKLGLEWLYRTVTQPERFKRIFPTLPLFIIRAFIYKLQNRR